MVDLEKEFKTLHVLAKTMVILGVAIVLAGVGTVLLTSGTKDAAKPPPAETSASAENDTAPPAAPAHSHSGDMKTVLSFTRDLGLRTAVLGAVLAVLGLLLRRVVRTTIDDGSFTDTDQDLFKAYAEQLAAAEKRKRQKKRLRVSE